MYLANCTRPDIIFVVNLLARHSSAPNKRNWKGVKHLLCYLKDTVDYTFHIILIKHGRDTRMLANCMILIMLDPRLVMYFYMVALQSLGVCKENHGCYFIQPF